MVDFVKFRCKDALFIKDKLFSGFWEKSNRKTKEVEPFEIAEYKGMKFKLWYTGFLEISGSLHKFKNEGLYNYDDFSHAMLCEVLHEFETLFGLDLKKCELQNIEFGVNIAPFMATAITLDNLLEHKNKRFDSDKDGKYRQAKHAQYICKLYDKGFQNKLGRQLMRWELKFVKMEKLKPMGIYCLHDLFQTSWIEPIGELLLAEWDTILTYDDTIRKEGLDRKTRDKKLLQWSNPTFWRGLNKFKKARELKKYILCVQHHSSSIQTQNKTRIQDKWNELKNATN